MQSLLFILKEDVIEGKRKCSLMVAYWERVWIMEGGSSGDLKTLFTLLHKKSRGISFYAGKGLVLNNTIRLLAVDATISSQLEVFLDNCLHCWLPQCLPLFKYQITAAINVLRLVLRQWFYQKYSTKMYLYCCLFICINFCFILKRLSRVN